MCFKLIKYILLIAAQVLLARPAQALEDSLALHILGSPTLILALVGVVALIVALVMWAWRYHTVLRIKNALHDALELAEIERIRTRVILDSMEDAISIFDRDKRLVYQNTNHRKIYASHLCQPCNRVFSCGEPPLCNDCPIDNVFKEGRPGLVVKVYGDRYYEISSSPLRNNNGQVVSVIVNERDVTERRQAEEALRDHEWSLLESQRIGRVGSYVLDISSETWTGSVVLDELFGIDASYDRSLNGWINLIHPDHRERVVRLFKENRGGRTAFQEEFKIIRAADKKERWVRVMAEFISDAENRLKTMHGTVQDITEQKQVEFVLQNQALLLQQEVSQRQSAQQLLVSKQEQLEVLNRMLEEKVVEEVEKNREKDQIMIHQSRLAALGEMIGNIAHQWRQPLNNVGLLVQGLEMDFNDNILTSESAREQVAKCMSLIHYMSGTIDDFRNFYRPNKEKESFVVGAAVERVVSMIKATFENQGVCLQVTGDGAGSVVGYVNEYSQVLLNILNNAKDALLETQPADPLITVTCETRGEKSVVTVHDNAGGVAASVMDHIFDPYFSTKGQAQGTGIGLYMAKMIIEKNMNGVLTVENVGEGALFTIEI